MRIISYLFDLLFPPRPQQSFLREIDRLTPQLGRHHDTEYLSLFKEETVKAAITENKYYNNSHAIKLLAELLEEWLSSQEGKTVLVPIPLSKERERTRGYNQVSEVLKILSTEVNVLDGVLVRVKDTESQTSLNKQQRRQNLRGAFAIKNRAALTKLEDTTIVIVDDVITTGATMEAARAKLSPHLPPSCKLKTLTFAH